MAEKKPLVGIVVLNYNGSDCLVPCLQSLRALEYDEKFVIVVDNGSEDGSMMSVQTLFPEFTYISNKENKGFAAGMNVGIRAALKKGAAFVWILNNDAQAEKEALARLIDETRKHECPGLFSPAIYDTLTKKLWFGKGVVRFARMRAVHVAPTESELQATSYESGFLTGCALLMSRELIETIGYLDERFFLYYEDADFSLRASAAGFRLLSVPGSRVWHGEQSRLSAGRLYHLVFSGLLFFEKHGKGLWRPYLFIYATIRRIKNRLDTAWGKRDSLPVRQAYKDFYYGGCSPSHLSRLRKLP